MASMALKRSLANTGLALASDPVCPRCTASYKRWGCHLRYNPLCKDAFDDACDDCEPDHIQLDAQTRERQEALAEAISELSYSKQLKPAEVQSAIALARVAIYQHNARAANGLRHLLAPGVSTEQVAAALDALEQQQPVFAGLETEAQQMSVLRRTYPYLPPRTVVFGAPKEKADSFSVVDLLARHLTHSPRVLKKCWEKSERWKSGELHNVEAEIFDDFDSGAALRRHTELTRKAAPDEVCDLRIGLIFYGDEVEVCAHTSNLDPRVRASPCPCRRPAAHASPPCACGPP